MPLPWKALLATVPWSEVIGKAPQLADGARKLWKGLNRKNGDTGETDWAGEPTTIPPNADLATRLDLLEAANRRLRTQLLASGEVIQGLGEQQAQLVAQIDSLRRQTRRQTWALWAIALFAGLALLAGQFRFLELFA